MCLPDSPLEASAGDRHCWVDFTEEEVKLQRKGSGVLRAVCKCHRAELGKRCGPVTPKVQALSLGRSSCNCFQSLLSGSRKHWLRYPLRAPSWADENVPESLSYQWGRQPLLPGRKDSAVCCSWLCSHKLPLIVPPFSPFSASSPILIRGEWCRVGVGWQRCVVNILGWH